jgi:hypothetical protein
MEDGDVYFLGFLFYILLDVFAGEVGGRVVSHLLPEIQIDQIRKAV